MPTIFSPMMVWDDPFEETHTFATDIQTTKSDLELRVVLREIARERYAFTTQVLREDWSWLRKLLVTKQNEQWAIPYWPHVTTLTAAVAAGSNVTLTCDTVDRAFRVDGLAVLWVDSRTAELVTVTAVTATSITVATVTGNYDAYKTRILPARLGYWGLDDLEVERPISFAGRLPVEFELVDGLESGIAQSSTPALFSVTHPNRRDDPKHTWHRRTSRFNSPSELFVDDATGTDPIGHLSELLLSLDSRSKVSNMLDWFRSMRGAASTFYFPTYSQDFALTANVNGTTVTFKKCGYTTDVYPMGTHYQRVAFITNGGTVSMRTVSAPVDNGDGTESFTIDSGLVFNKEQGLVSFCPLVRLASDELKIDWITPQYAETALELIELPHEA